MPRTLAFVLSGGGARGALQVGALRALLEAGYTPDLVVGTSIGAVNAAYLGVHGWSQESLDGLILAWQDAAVSSVLPSNYLWLIFRAALKRPVNLPADRMREFFINHGVSTELCFADLAGTPRLLIVATDLNCGRPVIYGLDPQQNVLEGLLASTALPPFIQPVTSNGRTLMDGGAVSNLPIEAALDQGVDEIIALDLADPRPSAAENHAFASFFLKLFYTMERRQADLELALAQARKVPVRYISLLGREPLATWEFHRSLELVETGYQVTRQEIENWRPSATLSPWQRLREKFKWRSR